MTIRELAEGCQTILDIHVEVRDKITKKLVHEYRFGGGAKYHSGDYALYGNRYIGGDESELKKHITVDATEINTYDVGYGKEYFELRLKKIPKKYQPILDREVSSWDLARTSRSGSSFWYPASELWVTIESEPEDAKGESELMKVSSKNDDIEGQMSTDDFEEWQP